MPGKMHKPTTITITTEYIKLDALLKFAGFAETGGRAKEMIEEGTILLNGERVMQRGRKVRPGDTVTFDAYTLQVLSGAV